VISRRRFLTGAALVLAPLGAPAHAQEYKAQQAGRVYGIGILGNVPPTDTEGARLWGALTQGLRELGYVEGQNTTVEHLSTEGRSARLPALAAELIRWKPDVIVVPNNLNALAARDATRAIPIVAVSRPK
jgi:ABC-type uncharacterized transport system substrate-binding protein